MEPVVGVALLRVLDQAFVERIGLLARRADLLDAHRALGEHRRQRRDTDPVGRLLVVIAVVPLRIVADRFDIDAALDPVAPAHRAGLARHRHQRVREIGIHLAEHPGQHAAKRQPHDELQVRNVQPFGDEAMLRQHNVMQPVMRKARAKPVARLAGAAEADDVGDDEKILCSVERLAGAEQLIGHRWLKPCLRRAGGVVNQQHRIGDAARGVGLRRAERQIVLPQRRQRLAGAQAEIAYVEVVFAEIGPVGFGHALAITDRRCVGKHTGCHVPFHAPESHSACCSAHPRSVGYRPSFRCRRLET